MIALILKLYQYDYAIWWGEAPHIIYTLVENINLKGKTVVPFCTSLSSGIGESGIHLEEAAKTSAKTNWLTGRNAFAENGEQVDQSVEILKNCI